MAKETTTEKFAKLLHAQAIELKKTSKQIQKLGSPKNRPPKDVAERIEAFALELEKCSVEAGS
jgi:hypothetical protein